MEYETVGAAVDGSAVGQPKYKVKAKRKPLEVFMNALFFLCGMVAVAFVLIISIYLVISGLPAILLYIGENSMTCFINIIIALLITAVVTAVVTWMLSMKFEKKEA